MHLQHILKLYALSTRLTLLNQTTCHYHVIVVHISFLRKEGNMCAIFCWSNDRLTYSRVGYKPIVWIYLNASYNILMRIIYWYALSFKSVQRPQEMNKWNEMIFKLMFISNGLCKTTVLQFAFYLNEPFVQRYLRWRWWTCMQKFCCFVEYVNSALEFHISAICKELLVNNSDKCMVCPLTSHTHIFVFILTI